MEKRYSKRLPVSMNVLLYDKHIPVAYCKTHDIGVDGLFLESESLAYAEDTILKIEFQIDSDTGTESHSLSAMVVRSSNTGLGLMLPGGDSKAMKAWRRKVRQAVIQNSINQVYEVLSDSHETTHTARKQATKG